VKLLLLQIERSLDLQLVLPTRKWCLHYHVGAKYPKFAYCDRPEVLASEVSSYDPLSQDANGVMVVAQVHQETFVLNFITDELRM